MLRLIKDFIINSIRKFRVIQKHPWDFPEIMLYEWLFSDLRFSNTDIFIIGAYHGYEVERLTKVCRFSKLYLFEPQPDSYNFLVSRFCRNKQIQVIAKAVCDYDGSIIFNEMNRSGNGSILLPSRLAIDSYHLSKLYHIEVPCITLDSFCLNNKSFPSVLWIDVQGAELSVLRGGKAILKKVVIIFIEVSILEATYEAGTVHSELDSFLTENGFVLTQLGTDLSNGTGNALYVKRNLFDKHWHIPQA